MKKRNLIIASAFIFLMIFSVLAYAEGSSGNSEGGSSDSSGSSGNSENDSSPALTSQDIENRRIRIDCEGKQTVEKRVKCRLEHKNVIERSRLKERIEEEHESCRNLGATGKGNCEKLYRDIKGCDEERGKRKDLCFKLKTGFETSAVSGQGINKEAARKYLVALLYELEKKVEDKVTDGTINATQGSAIVAQIILIKEKILKEAPGSEIRPELKKLRKMWKEAFPSSGVREESSSDSENEDNNNSDTGSDDNNSADDSDDDETEDDENNSGGTS